MPASRAHWQCVLAKTGYAFSHARSTTGEKRREGRVKHTNLVFTKLLCECERARVCNKVMYLFPLLLTAYLATAALVVVVVVNYVITHLHALPCMGKSLGLSIRVSIRLAILIFPSPWSKSTSNIRALNQRKSSLYSISSVVLNETDRSTVSYCQQLEASTTVLVVNTRHIFDDYGFENKIFSRLEDKVNAT